MRAYSENELEQFIASDRGVLLRQQAWWGDGWNRRGIPAEDLGKCFLSDQTAGAIAQGGGDIFLQVTDWSIFPNYDNPRIFRGYRSLLGDPRPLIEARAHVFASTEIEHVRNLFNLGMLYLYDMQLLNLSTGSAVSISHHDEFDFRFNQASVNESFCNWFDGENPYWSELV